MNIVEAFIETYKNKELVAGFNRLHGTHIRQNRKKLSPMEVAIDNATGHTPAALETLGEDGNEMKLFFDFFVDYIWSRIPRDNPNEKL